MVMHHFERIPGMAQRVAMAPEGLGQEAEGQSLRKEALGTKEGTKEGGGMKALKWIVELIVGVVIAIWGAFYGPESHSAKRYEGR